MGEKDSVIILSGGMDSVTLLYDMKERIALALSFDYGSNHNASELPFADLHCRRLGIAHITLKMEFIAEYFKSSLLEGASAVPEGHYTAESMKSTVVPFRNGIMLAVAAGIAESRGLRRVMMASHSGDHTIYPDCRQEFIAAMTAATTLGTDTHVEIVAPYGGMDKTEIAARGKALGIDYTETWSCYKGGKVQCGRCGTCVERREALAGAGIDDKTEYLDVRM